MAEEELFVQADGYLQATIDNQTENNIKVYKINKQETRIILNQSSLDTAINEDIYISGTVITTNQDSDTQNKFRAQTGIMYIKILNASNQVIIEETTPLERNGLFSICLPNKLQMGTYYCVIEYPESKYFLSCSHTTQFDITKRTIGYKLDKSSYSGYPNQEVTVKLYLYDYKTKLPIEVLMSYSFDGKEYLVRSDGDGYATINITIPDVNKEDCKSFMDEYNAYIKTITPVEEQEEEPQRIYMMGLKGWVYQNGQLIQWFDDEYTYYVNRNPVTIVEEGMSDPEKAERETTQLKYHILTINIDDEKYVAYPIAIRIYVKKSPTTIDVHTIKPADDKIRLAGDVYGAIGKAKYGKMGFQVINQNQEEIFFINDDGSFEFFYDPVESMLQSSNNRKEIDHQNTIHDKMTLTELIIADTYDDVDDETYIYNVYNNKQLKAIVNVTTSEDEKPVLEGMVRFTIVRKRDGKINYKYTEEITDDGQAIMLFDLSTVGDYYIYAEYFGMFNYLNSNSDFKQYTVINEKIDG